MGFTCKSRPETAAERSLGIAPDRIAIILLKFRGIGANDETTIAPRRQSDSGPPALTFFRLNQGEAVAKRIKPVAMSHIVDGSGVTVIVATQSASLVSSSGAAPTPWSW